MLERSRERPVVVDFWAEWCGPCRALTPVLEEEIAALAGAAELAKVDVVANPVLASRYGVSGIPAVKAFRNGDVVAEFVGARPRPAVRQFLEELTGPTGAERVLAQLEESGELPEVAEAVATGDHERALELLLDEVHAAPPERRATLRDLAVALFGDLGMEHPLTLRYRRRLAAALY